MIKKENLSGFTLIELLIVIAILGILAVVILVVMNPGERQAQARDTGRISSVAQLGRSLQAYYTTKTSMPDVGTWATDLVTQGEISSFPSGIAYSYNSVSACTTYAQPAINSTFCYDEDSNSGAVVFSKAESTTYRSRCTAPEEAYFVFSTADSRGGTICSNGDPVPWASGSMTYVP
jgi:prepilin-type N-terminal cleavage/methylation domain-containing protein